MPPDRRFMSMFYILCEGQRHCCCYWAASKDVLCSPARDAQPEITCISLRYMLFRFFRVNTRRVYSIYDIVENETIPTERGSAVESSGTHNIYQKSCFVSIDWLYLLLLTATLSRVSIVFVTSLANVQGIHDKMGSR